MVRLWLLGSVLLAPLAVWPAPGDPMQFRNAFFIVAGLVGILWLVPNWWLRAFCGWAVVSFALTGATWWGMAGLLGLLAWVIFYREAAHLTDRQWANLRVAVLVACAFQVGWMGLQAIGRDPLFQPVSWRGELVPAASLQIAGWLLNPMDAALFLGLSAPLLMALSPWYLLLVAVPILLWLKATAGLAAIAIAAGWHFRASWKITVPVLALVVGIWAWQLDPQGFGPKPTVWRSLGLVVARQPVLGAGPNALGYSVRTFQPVPIQDGTGVTADRHETLEWNFAFNEWLQGTVEFGVVGLALAAAYVGSLIWRLRRRWTLVGECAPAFLILLATSLGSIPFRIGPVALLSALYLGRLDALLSDEVAA